MQISEKHSSVNANLRKNTCQSMQITEKHLSFSM